MHLGRLLTIRSQANGHRNQLNTIDKAVKAALPYTQSNMDLTKFHERDYTPNEQIGFRAE